MQSICHQEVGIMKLHSEEADVAPLHVWLPDFIQADLPTVLGVSVK